MPARSDEAGHGAGDVDSADVAQSEQGVAGEVADDPAVQRVAPGVDVAVVADQHDETEGNEHDAGNEREVDVRVGVAGEARPGDA